MDATPSAAELADLAEEVDVVGERKRGNRGGKTAAGGGGRRGGGGGGGGREVLISKALSKLLRHAAEEEGLKLDSEGFARLDLVVSLPNISSTFSMGNI
jgi:2'-phosphotransferase